MPSHQDQIVAGENVRQVSSYMCPASGDTISFILNGKKLLAAGHSHTLHTHADAVCPQGETEELQVVIS